MKKFLLLIGILALALGLFADVTIGSGTSTQRQPFDALYGFGRSADIYLASEINATGNITHLGWYVGLATSTSIPIKIYLTTTTATSLAQTPWATLTAGLTPVYNATAQFNALGWAQLDITDFAYNHQTSGNLLVLCEANYTGSGAASTDCPEFRYTNDGNTGSMHQYWQQDGEAPTFDGRVTADRPNIKFDMVKEYDTCANPYLATLPLVDYNGTTAGLTNDYTADMFSGMTIDPRYCTGKDWVAKLSISEDGLLNVSLDDQPGSPWQYISMVLVSTIPSTESPAVVLAQHCTGYGPLSITNFPVTAGYYYLIVDNFPGPEDIHFVLNITHSIYPPEPASLVSPADGATNITLDTTLNWASGGGQVDGYKLSLWEDLSTHQVEILTDLDLGMDTTFDPTLEYAKEYSWKVVPYSNAGGEAVDCPTWTFSTMDAPISSFPYFEGFEVNADTLPLNWIATEAAPNASQHWKAAASAEHGPSAPASGSSFAWLYCYHASANYNPYSLVSPPLALDATAKRLSYQYWIGDDTVAEPLFVDISTDLASWTTLYTHSNASNTLAWHYNVISLAAYSSQTVYLRFRGVSNYGNGMTDLGIDNIWIEDIPSYPILTCSPTDINFGDVMQGVQTGPRYVTITNTGGGILNLVAADISFAAVPSNPVTDFSFGAGNLPAALATGESVLIPVYVNASSEGPLYGSLQIVNNQGPQPAYSYVNLSANGLSEDMVAIGDGHFNLEIPINPYYGYSYSQSIFLQSEINVPDQRIEKVFYYWNGAAEANVSNDWTMYMGHTALTEFADESSWIPRANLSPVFQGTVALPATPGWIEISLDTPFLHNNTANLVIAVDENEAGWDGRSMYFLSTATATNRSICYYTDGINPDPATPPTGSLVAGHPNLKLQFVAPLAEEPGTVTLNWPQEEATNLPRTGFDLSWTPSPYGGIPTHYTLYLNQTQNSDCIYDGLVFENLTGTSFNTVTDGNLSFNYGEYWCWMVVAHNSYGSSEDNITNRFQIGEDPTITIPHTQNFDAATFPYGWTQANIGISSD
ncbi:MAG: choice-of-anchor J domain-containing protein, partial [Candidatus Cloacimonadaceae bacterium]|nr:choice-of-anchor J domain-containing protein [Candidatus Cloacimonadaceae bacterium]